MLVGHPFEILEGPAPFRDQIWLAEEQWASVEPGWEEAEQRRRFNAWLAVLNNPQISEPNRPDEIGGED